MHHDLQFRALKQRAGVRLPDWLGRVELLDEPVMKLLLPSTGITAAHINDKDWMS